MLVNKRELTENELYQLMAIYRESNTENISYFYPDEKDQAKGLIKVERDHSHYITNDFLLQDNTNYFILVDNDLWVSALRFYKLGNSNYFFEALETIPNHRNKGYGKQLLTSVINDLKKEDHFELHSYVHETNLISLKTHKAVGFVETGLKAYDYAEREPVEDSIALIYTYSK